MTAKMTSEKFARGIHESVVEELAKEHKHLFETTDISAATDPYWIKAQGLFNKLGQQDRGILLSMMRHASLDTTAELLSLFDGGSRVSGQTSDIVIGLESGPESLGGDLVDMFLAVEQEKDVAL